MVRRGNDVTWGRRSGTPRFVPLFTGGLWAAPSHWLPAFCSLLGRYGREGTISTGKGEEEGRIHTYCSLRRRAMRATAPLTCRLCVVTALATFVAGVVVGLFISNFPLGWTRVKKDGLSDLVDGVYWSDRLDRLVPRGFDGDAYREWRQVCRNWSVIRVEMDGACGRNRRLTFLNGSQACCRHRNNVDQIQGDIFSFYLARTLGIRHLPPAALVLPRAKDTQWRHVKPQLSLAQWRQDRPVVITKFVDGLEPANIPPSLRQSGRRVHPTAQDLGHLTTSQLIELVQWSDLILFDYLTANLDRVVNNLHNKQWNSNMMDAPAHNLVKTIDSGLLLFLDNESGLVHGYRLLDKYEAYHRAFLNALCVFRRTTVQAIRQLHHRRNAGTVLQNAFQQGEGPLAETLPSLPHRTHKILQQRIDHVHRHISRCEEFYPSHR